MATLILELLQQLRALLLEWQPTLIQGPVWEPASGRGGPPLALFQPLLQELLQLQALLEWQPTMIQGHLFWEPASACWEPAAKEENVTHHCDPLVELPPPLALFQPLALFWRPLPAPRL